MTTKDTTPQQGQQGQDQGFTAYGDQKWEYTTAVSSTVDQMPYNLNWLGIQGWEVVGVVTHPTKPDMARCILKRRLIKDRIDDPSTELVRQPESTHHAPVEGEPGYDSPPWTGYRANRERLVRQRDVQEEEEVGDTYAEHGRQPEHLTRRHADAAADTPDTADMGDELGT